MLTLPPKNGGLVDDQHDVEQLFVRVLEMLRMHQEALFKANLSVHAAVEALKEFDPQFAEAYERHFWDLKQGQLGEENSTAVRIIDQLKRDLRGAHATGAGAGTD